MNFFIRSFIVIFGLLCTFVFKSTEFSVHNNLDNKFNQITIDKQDITETFFFNLTYSSRFIYQLRDQVLNFLPDFKTSTLVSKSCVTAFQSLLNEPTLYRWSLSMLDANAPMPTSLLSDGITSVGGFDQCLAIDDHFYNHQKVVPIKGQYCLLNLKIAENASQEQKSKNKLLNSLFYHLSHVNKRFPVTLGLCIPSLCAPEEVNYFSEKYFEENGMSSLFRTKVEHCQSEPDFLGPDKSVLELLAEHNLLLVGPILATMIILVLLGTLVELKLTFFDQPSKENETSSVSFLKCFSIIKNTAILFGHHQQNSKFKVEDGSDLKIEHRLSFLHGIRAALVAWIVTAHSIALLPVSIAMPVSMIARHPHDMIALAAKNGLLSTFFNNGTLAVEAFFLISGLLLVSLSIEKSWLLEKLNFFSFVALRWLRFAPPLLGVIVFWKVASILGNGPFFARSLLEESVQRPCHDGSWWRSFLFINNWGNLSDTCIPPSWFISADMQIHILAYVIIILLRNSYRRLIFNIFCGTMITFSLVLPVCLLIFTDLKTFSNLDLFAGSLETNETSNSTINSYIFFYTGAHVHMGAYFYGAILGYFLVVKNCKSSALSQKLSCGPVWWSSLAVTLICPFLNTPQLRSDDTLGHLERGLLVGLLHVTWTLAFGLVLFTLAQPTSKSRTKSVAIVRRFLSCQLLRPLSRLSFSMYLTHMLLIWFNVYSAKVPFEVNTLSMTLFAFGILVETIILSYLLFILFECPSVNLIKVFASGTCQLQEKESFNAVSQKVVDTEKIEVDRKLKNETLLQFLHNGVQSNTEKHCLKMV